ncbi:MAG TPA: hypothetical protein PKI81_09595 [bacterium]|jgi:hypothetical protein|nr:hypothetical protein [bacterium]HOC88407.1 hypothetical protein [bacterium]
MKVVLDYDRALIIFLWLIAIHSFLVGLGLIFMPYSLLEQLGYASCSERFFRAQGGVFHIVMAIGYAMAAVRARQFECLIIFSIVVKFAATIFLFAYASLVKNLAVILLSGVIDFLMGVVLYYLFRTAKRKRSDGR